MSQELFYTSAPKGLQPGSRGFCTVAATRGLSAALVEKLESLSGYRPLFPPHDARAGMNPVAFVHVRISAGGKMYTVVSRIGPAGLDYTERPNKFAHHVVLDPAELPAGGPAWLLRQPGFLEARWDGQVQVLAAGRITPRGDMAPEVCRSWQALTGDAGWGGVLAEAVQADPSRLVYLVFDPGMDLLPPLAEALALLPPEQRWEVTFSTYFTGLPQGAQCLWRCVPRGSPEAKGARQFPGALILDLGRELGTARGGPLVAKARGQSMVELPNPSARISEVEGTEGTSGEAGSTIFRAKSVKQSSILAESGRDESVQVLAPPLPPNSFQFNETPGSPIPPLPPLPPSVKSGQKASLKSKGLTLAAGTVIGCLATSLVVFLVVPLAGFNLIDQKVSQDDKKDPETKTPAGQKGTSETKFDGKKKELDAREAAIRVHEDKVSRRELDIQERERKAADREKKNKEKEASLAQKAAALKKKSSPLDKKPEQKPPGGDRPNKNASLERQLRFVEHYFRIPNEGKNKEKLEVPTTAKYKLSLMALDTTVDGNTELVPPEPGATLKILFKGEDKPIAHFSVEGAHLYFEWVDTEKKQETLRKVRRLLRNSVLKVESEDGPNKETFLVGLMQNSQPDIPMTFNFANGRDLIRDLGPLFVEKPLPERMLFVKSAECELKSATQISAALASNPLNLKWNGGDLEFRVRREKDEKLNLVVKWNGPKTGAPILTIKSFEICMMAPDAGAATGIGVNVLKVTERKSAEKPAK